jgi:hypothetical protein
VGYSVLRIPAKIVFTAPGEAVDKVRSALSASPPKPANPVQPARQFSARTSLGLVVKAISDLDAYVTRAAAVQSAVSDPRRMFGLERIIIEGALEQAEVSISAAEFRAKSADHARLYEESYAEIEKALSAHREPARDSHAPEMVPSLEAPAPHEDPLVHEAIQGEYGNLIQERAKYLQEVRHRLAMNSRLRDLVRNHLQETGYASVWASLSA